jgi:hypothetical protein
MIPGLAPLARDVVAAQLDLDRLAHESLDRWSEDGTPPIAVVYSRLRVDFGTPARVRLGLRLFPRDQETLDASP